MRLPENRTGMSTSGAVGIAILVAVMWGQISPWWLIVSGIFTFSGIGQESGLPKK